MAKPAFKTTSASILSPLGLVLSDRPYHNARTNWLQEHAELFLSVLEAASRHKADLERFYSASREAPVDLLEFCDIGEADLATAHKVCDRLMSELSPTLQAMQKELERRGEQPGDQRLGIVQ